MFPQIFGKYVLERELASGGMARVYLATLRGAVGFEKRLVVKQIRPELASDYAFVQRFVEEAKTAVELSHPNIVPVYELGVEQGVYYIAMELCTGVTLAEVLASTGKLSPEEGAYVGVEICRALDYAHRRAGIVHRDATPRNVLLDEEGAIRLIDFGIALPVARDDARKAEVFGSPGHMPPEQLAGKPLSAATDVFAVAALLVEAWSGRPPFRRKTARESQEALYQPLEPLGTHDPKLEPLAELIASALSHEPKERPAQAELFARPLRDFLRTVDSGDVARKLGARVRRAKRRSERGGSAATGRESAPSYPGSEPRTPNAPEQLSRTFAAREEVEHWTRRLDSSPAQSSGPSTRKLPSIPPPGTPPDLESKSAATKRSAETEPDPSAVNDTPPQAISPRPAAKPARPFRSVGSVLAVASIAVGLVWMAEAPSRLKSAEPLRSPAAQPKATPEPPKDVTAPPAGPSEPPPSNDQRRSRTIAATLTSSTSPSVSTGVLRLTADPPAGVTVTGAGKSRTLRTPVRELRLPAGSYTVTFQSETYGAPVIARVVVDGDRVRSVHADFREADPRVTVR